MLLVSGISVYATLSFTAGDIEYTKSGTNTKISVANALNELYQNKKETTDNVRNITQNGSVQLDKYYKNLNVNVPIPAGYVAPSGTKTITTKANNIDVKNYQYVDTTGMYTAEEYQYNYSLGYNNGITTNSLGNTYNYGSGTASSQGVLNFDIGFAEPRQFWIFVDYGTARVYNHYIKQNPGYTRYMVSSKGVTSLTSVDSLNMTGTVFNFNNSNMPNSEIHWVAIK